MKWPISIVVPALNEELLIGRCIDSIKAQDYTGPVEVIVVDNGSGDSTSKIAAARGAKVVFEPKRGVCAARQKGTEVAKGEIIVSTDADTTYPADWLTKISNRFDERPELVGVTGPCEFVDAPWWGNAFFRFVLGLSRVVQRLTGRLPYGMAANIAFKKSCWRGYDTGLSQGGDEIYLLSSLQKHGPMEYDPDIKVYTSSRRLRKGLIYNFFVTFLAHYLLEYAYSRLTGRKLLGHYSPIRDA